jgi:hypothetical protein
VQAAEQDGVDLVIAAAVGVVGEPQGVEVDSVTAVDGEDREALVVVAEAVAVFQEVDVVAVVASPDVDEEVTERTLIDASNRFAQTKQNERLLHPANQVWLSQSPTHTTILFHGVWEFYRLSDGRCHSSSLCFGHKVDSRYGIESGLQNTTEFSLISTTTTYFIATYRSDLT